jgi:hypothetical protein
MNLISSPLTSTSGAGLMLSAILDLAYHAVNDKQLSPNAGADMNAIIGGIGLLFAKDWNVTGGTKQP